jgi:hypothetical protein
MKENNRLYEMIAVSFKLFLVAARDPGSVIQELSEKPKFKLKGVKL